MRQWGWHFLQRPSLLWTLLLCVQFLTLHGDCKIPAVAPTLDMAAFGSLTHFYTKSEPRSQLFIMWNLHGAREIFSRFFSRRRETFADGELSLSLRHSRWGLLWWSCCSATQGNRQPKSVPAAFLSWMLVAERRELHGTPVMGFLRVLKLPYPPN